MTDTVLAYFLSLLSVTWFDVISWLWCLSVSWPAFWWTWLCHGVLSCPQWNPIQPTLPGLCKLSTLGVIDQTQCCWHLISCGWQICWGALLCSQWAPPVLGQDNKCGRIRIWRWACALCFHQTCWSQCPCFVAFMAFAGVASSFCSVLECHGLVVENIPTIQLLQVAQRVCLLLYLIAKC